MSGPFSSRIVAASAVAALLAWPRPAMAEPFCDFLKQVLAAKGDGFARLRGPAKGKPEDKQYQGTLKPQPDASCTASPADVGGLPYYSCYFGKYSRLVQGEPHYYDLAAQTRRCFPAAAFKDKRVQPKAGDPFPFEGREIKGVVDGYEITLTLDNGLSAMRWIVDQMRGSKDKTPVSYEIAVDVRRAR